MKKLKEENDLQAITGEYSKAIEQYQKRNLALAQEIFSKIISDYQNSEFYSVLEIQTRSKVYYNIIQSQVNPQKVELKTSDDFLWEGVYQLNRGNFDLAVEYLSKAQKSNPDPYIPFLLAIATSHLGDSDKALGHLETCIGKDPFYRILAFNEPDLEVLKSDPRFQSLVE